MHRMSLGRSIFLKVQLTLCIRTRRGQEHELQSCLSRLLLSWAAHRKKTIIYAAWMNDFVLYQKKKPNKTTNQTKNNPNQPCRVSREKNRSFSFLSSLPAKRFQARSKHSLVLNAIPFIIGKLVLRLSQSSQPPEAGHPMRFGISCHLSILLLAFALSISLPRVPQYCCYCKLFPIWSGLPQKRLSEGIWGCLPPGNGIDSPLPHTLTGVRAVQPMAGYSIPEAQARKANCSAELFSVSTPEEI